MSALHFCIDMQREGRCDDKGQTYDFWLPLKKNIVRTCKSLRERDVDSVFVAYGEKEYFNPLSTGVGCWRNVPADMRRVLEQRPSLNFDMDLRNADWVAFKRHCSLYREPAVVDYVRRSGATTIFLSGVFEGAWDEDKRVFNWSDYCVSETARAFANAGYKVIIVAEATQRGIPDASFFRLLDDRRSGHAKWGVSIDPLDDICAVLDAEARQIRYRRVGGAVSFKL